MQRMAVLILEIFDFMEQLCYITNLQFTHIYISHDHEIRSRVFILLILDIFIII